MASTIFGDSSIVFAELMARMRRGAIGMLKGKTVSLRLIERIELPIVLEWENDASFMGEFEPISQKTVTDLQKQYDDSKDARWFFIENKDKKIIGYIAHGPLEKHRMIRYALIPEERGEGYVSEAIKIMVDYLFLSNEIARIKSRPIKRIWHPR